MMIANDRPTCMACKLKFLGSSKDKIWRLLPLKYIKDLDISKDILQVHSFGLLCGECIEKSKDAQNLLDRYSGNRK